MTSLSGVTPLASYSARSSSASLNVPSSLTVCAHGMLRGARDVAGSLGGLAHAGRRDDLAVELGRRAHVDERELGVAEARQDVVAEGPQREVGLGQLVAGRRRSVGTSVVSGRPWSSQYLRPPSRMRTSSWPYSLSCQ